jgi:phosphoenolpyruvate carboxykinase (ATP)
MSSIQNKDSVAVSKAVGIANPARVYYNATPEELIEETILRGQGHLSDKGALLVKTGEFTGRSPKDKFIVSDAKTEPEVNWGGFNTRFDAEMFVKLEQKMLRYFDGKDVFIRDNYVCADENYRLNVRTVTEYPWSNMFANNMFLRPQADDSFEPDWTILCAPEFYADPSGRWNKAAQFFDCRFYSKESVDRWLRIYR